MLQHTSNPQREACDFCDEFAGGHRNAYVDRYGNSARRIIMGSPQFRIVPTLGQIVEGHLLIVPKVHCCALADLPGEQISEFSSLHRKVRSILESTYDQCVCFEHGVRNAGDGGCGIDHAHLHAVPVAAEGVLATLEQEFQGTRIDSFETITHVVPEGSSYLFFEDASGARLVFPASKLPSQYMRKLVAESIGKSVWDWRNSRCERELIATIQTLSPLFTRAPVE